MAPKKEPKAASKQAQAQRQKVVEDKTFGLKNKNKSKAVQAYVKNLQSSVNKPRRGEVDVKEQQKKKREEEAAREKELAEIFKVAIVQPKVPLGVDPKSIVCEFFRHNQCTKGFKCKFSHDLSVERKGHKIDLYSDTRDGEEEDKMEDWDQEKLESVVASKGNEYKNANKPTEIVCKYFLEAVESKKYGWFWACPNGGKDCMYRHALPPGYVLKSQMKQLLEEEAQNKMSVEEMIEQERHMTKSQTKLTTEVFMEWKRKKRELKEAEQAARRAARAKEDRMSGRELFAADASLFVDDAAAYDEYEREDVGDEAAEKQQQRRQLEEQAALRRQHEQEGHMPAAGETSGNGAGPSASGAGLELTAEEEAMLAEDDDELDLEELEELEASLEQSRLEEPPQQRGAS